MEAPVAGIDVSKDKLIVYFKVNSTSLLMISEVMRR
jgi:hypothetical protein